MATTAMARNSKKEKSLMTLDTDSTHTHPQTSAMTRGGGLGGVVGDVRGRDGSAHGGGGGEGESSKGNDDTSMTIEVGLGLIAATLHNISLKRAALGNGVLALLLSMMKNTKTLRVLHCVRTLANISTQSKAKHILCKEKRFIPLLTALMRYGCDEADRVQHYW